MRGSKKKVSVTKSKSNQKPKNFIGQLSGTYKKILNTENGPFMNGTSVLASDLTNKGKDTMKSNNANIIRTGSSTKRNLPPDEEVKSTSKKKKALLSVPARSQSVGKVFVVGQGDAGQLGLDEGVYERPRFTFVPSLSQVVDIAAGGMHTVCLTDQGIVYTFGCNDEGALGRNTENDGAEFVPGIVEIPGNVVQITAGDSHSVALTDTGEVYIWGNFRDQKGQLGLTPDGCRQPTPIRMMKDIVVVRIASGCDHFACISEEGKIYTCGVSEKGQLGRVSSYFFERGGRRGLEYLLYPDSVKISNTKFDSVFTGSYNSFCGVKDELEVYGFGLNNYSQLGCPNAQVFLLLPSVISTFSNKKWKQISGGMHHTLALDENGKVYSIGRKEYGRLGLGENCEDTVDQLTEIQALNSIKCINISAGEAVSYAVTDQGKLYSWGFGTNLQLGHGNEEDVYSPKLVEEIRLQSLKVVKVSGGGQHAVILACDQSHEN